MTSPDTGPALPTEWAWGPDVICSRAVLRGEGIARVDTELSPLSTLVLPAGLKQEGAETTIRT
jgi:hypothetical protein